MTFSLLNIFTIDSLDPNESIIDFYANPLSTFLPFDNSLQIGASAPETNMHMFSNVVHSEYWRPSPLLDRQSAEQSNTTTYNILTDVLSEEQ